ncbi:MAG: YdcF family protein [Rhodobacterales bacterium]
MDTTIFVLGKLAGLAIRPDIWLTFGVLLTFWGLCRGRSALARAAGAITIVALLSFGMLPLGDLLLRPLETRHPVAPYTPAIDGIVVLGGGEDAERSALWGQVQLGEGAERLTEGLRLARLHPEAQLVFTGGSGALRDALGGGQSGADVAETFWTEQGLTDATLERVSRNTAENARATVDLIGQRPSETWVLITSAFHMPRALQSFRAAGWPDITPWPVDFRSRSLSRGIGWDLDGNLGRMRTALNEYLGLIGYRLAGR